MNKDHVERLIGRYPSLAVCEETIRGAYETLYACFRTGHKLLLCGNGGSAADAEHIVGELMKGFLLARELPPEYRERFREIDAESGDYLARRLQQPLPAVSLCGTPALSSAVVNDNAGDLTFAQLAFGYALPGDVLLAISTSGNSPNVVYAAVAARVRGAGVVSLTGRDGGRLSPLSSVSIRVPETETYKIQELHLPVYHCLCSMLEEAFFGVRGGVRPGACL